MEDLICIILIFLFLGLFMNNILPIFEGMDCTGGFVYDPVGEEGKLGDAAQTDYNEKKEKNKDLMNSRGCIVNLMNENKALVNTYDKDYLKPLDSDYKKKIVPSYNSFKKTRKNFSKSVDALNDIVNGDGEKKNKEIESPTECGKITDPVGAAPHEDIGKPIDSKGASCK